jgi:hypothetical protein
MKPSQLNFPTFHNLLRKQYDFSAMPQAPQPGPAQPNPPVVDQHLERLNVSISEKYCSGTRQIDAQNLLLYYGKDHIARFVFCCPGYQPCTHLTPWIVALGLDISSATEADLADLTEACDAATFGLGDEDVLNEFYRKAGRWT